MTSMKAKTWCFWFLCILHQTTERTDHRGSVKTFHCSMSDHSDCEIWDLRRGVTCPRSLGHTVSFDSCACPARLPPSSCWGKTNHAPFVRFPWALLLSAGIQRHSNSILLTLIVLLCWFTEQILPKDGDARFWRVLTIYAVSTKQRPCSFQCSDLQNENTPSSWVLPVCFHLPTGIVMKFKALHILKGVEI